MLEPWYLPGMASVTAAAAALSRDAAGAWHEGETAAGGRFRVPALDRDSAARVADSVREAALTARKLRSTAEVIGAVSRAAARLTDLHGADGRRTVDLLREELGWSRATVEEVLAGMARYWTAEALTEMVRIEVRDDAFLDGFHSEAGPVNRQRRAAGPPLMLVVHAGNVPGVAVTATIRGLLARSGLLCKVPEAEPGLIAGFARCLGAEDALLASCVAATWWPIREETPEWLEWERRSGKVVVYGGREAVEGVRGRVTAGRDVVVYGPGVGVGFVLPDAGEAAAVALARDVCAYEQQGCVSPRIVYVIGDATGFSEALADGLRDETRRLAVPAPPAGDAVAIRAARAAWELEGYERGDGSRVLGAADLTWTVLSSPSTTARVESLTRVVYLLGAPDLEEALTALEPLSGNVQSIGYAGTIGLERLAEEAVRLGVSRVAPFGTLAWPPADWRHEGRHQLLPLLTWTDLEPPA